MAVTGLIFIGELLRASLTFSNQDACVNGPTPGSYHVRYVDPDYTEEINQAIQDVKDGTSWQKERFGYYCMDESTGTGFYVPLSGGLREGPLGYTSVASYDYNDVYAKYSTHKLEQQVAVRKSESEDAKFDNILNGLTGGAKPVATETPKASSQSDQVALYRMMMWKATGNEMWLTIPLN